jgi:dolichol-phosphate mannosyltransferase
VSEEPVSLPEKPCLYAVVPVFNEYDNMERLIASFCRLDAEFGSRFRLRIVLADDGSTDGTASRAQDLAANLDLNVLSSPSNQGPGAAFGNAFEFLASHLQPNDWVVTMEGDNTSRAELLGQMLRRADEGYDVVLASPYMYGGGIAHTTPMRVFMSHMANAFVKELLGAHGFLTVSSFFRLFRGDVVTRLQTAYGPRIVERPGFECMVELLLKMVYLETRITEVPMLLDTSLRAGVSKLKVVRTMRGYLSLFGRLRQWKKTGQAHSSSWRASDRSGLLRMSA